MRDFFQRINENFLKTSTTRMQVLRKNQPSIKNVAQRNPVFYETGHSPFKKQQKHR